MESRFYLKVLIHFAVGIVFGCFFQGVGADAGKMLNNVGFIGISVTYMAYTSMTPAVLTLPFEVLFIRREHFNNYYYLPTYYAMYIVSAIPQQIIFAFVFTSLTYVMSEQLLDPARYAVYLYAGIMINIISDAFGQIIGTILKASNGTFIAGVLTAYLLLLSGFLVVVRQSLLARILSYTSFHRYALHALIFATLGNEREKLPCLSDYCHYNVETLLEEYSFNSHPFFFDVVYLIVTYVVACFIGYFALKIKTKSW